MGVVIGVTEGVSSESVEGSAAFRFPPRLLGAWALPFLAAALPFAAALVEAFAVLPVFLEFFFLSFAFSVPLLLVLLLVASSVLLLAADLFLAPPLLFSAASFLFDAVLFFSDGMFLVLVLAVVSLFPLPFLLAPPLPVLAVAEVAVVVVVVVALSSLHSGGCGSSRVLADGSYNKTHSMHVLKRSMFYHLKTNRC